MTPDTGRGRTTDMQQEQQRLQSLSTQPQPKYSSPYQQLHLLLLLQRVLLQTEQLSHAIFADTHIVPLYSATCSFPVMVEDTCVHPCFSLQTVLGQTRRHRPSVWLCTRLYSLHFTTTPRNPSTTASAYLSLYLITASTIFFIFLVRLGGFGDSFSAGGRPRFFCFLLSSSLSRLRVLVVGVEEPASLSRLRLREDFFCRTSSSISSSVPSSIAFRVNSGKIGQPAPRSTQRGRDAHSWGPAGEGGSPHTDILPAWLARAQYLLGTPTVS